MTELQNYSFVSDEEKAREGLTLEWQNINFHVPAADKTSDHKVLLSKMSGIAYPGELLAVMGSSGAGF